MTGLPVYLVYRCGQCGGDGWVLSSHRGPVLCRACGAPMRCCDRHQPAPPVGQPLWLDSQNVIRGWIGGGQ